MPQKIRGTVDERRDRVEFAWRAFEDVIMDECGESRERSLAQTNAEQAFMWASSAVARTK